MGLVIDTVTERNFGGTTVSEELKNGDTGRAQNVSGYLAKEQKSGYSGKETTFSGFVVSRKMVESETEISPT